MAETWSLLIMSEGRSEGVGDLQGSHPPPFCICVSQSFIRSLTHPMYPPPAIAKLSALLLRWMNSPKRPFLPRATVLCVSV